MRTWLPMAGAALVGLMLTARSERIAAAEPPKDPTAQGANEDLTAPPDVGAPPADAQTTQSGLAYRVLRVGKGLLHPLAKDRVEVHYTGWTTDGTMFDSSVARGKTMVFPLTAVIKGWTEGVQLMVTGEKTRFWIPAVLAYGRHPRPGAPAGMLVFDIELIDIK
jgi:FKBP-type peptidyl-prolyl cis-trans isomerase